MQCTIYKWAQNQTIAVLEEEEGSLMVWLKQITHFPNTATQILIGSTTFSDNMHCVGQKYCSFTVTGVISRLQVYIIGCSIVLYVNKYILHHSEHVR
jgi:hypothetical protein